jgi:hypothetical protein
MEMINCLLISRDRIIGFGFCLVAGGADGAVI